MLNIRVSRSRHDNSLRVSNHNIPSKINKKSRYECLNYQRHHTARDQVAEERTLHRSLDTN